MNPIHNAFPIVASAIGKKADVEIVWGEKASTDGHKIELPYFDPQSDRLRRIALGYTIHECGHVRFSDFEFPETTPLQHRLANCIEDARIERCMMREYGGAANLLKEMNEEVFLGDKRPSDEEIQNKKPSSKLLDFVLLQQRSQLPGQSSLRPVAKSYMQAVEETFPKGAVARLKGLLTQHEELKSSADAWNLAAQIYTMLEEEEQEEEQPPEEERSSGEGDDDEQNESSSNTMSDQSDEAESSQGNDGAAKQAALKEALADQNPQSLDVGQIMAEELDEGYKEAERTGQGSLGGKAPSSTDAITENTSEVNAAKTMVNRLQRKLRTALEASNRSNHYLARSGRCFDQKRLCGIFVGNNRVFKRRDEKRLATASVVLLIDRSASMKKTDYYDATAGKPVSRIEAARRAALGLALTIDTFANVELAGMAFPGRTADVIDIQSFGQTGRATSGRYGGLDGSGGTPLARALQYSAKQLLSRSKERKIIIVLSDGEPADKNLVEQTIESCKRSNIELYGLALASNALASYIEDTTYLKDAQSLPDTLFRLADRLLRH